MQEPRWLSRSVIGIIHTDLIREHGGRFGVREEGLIQSALDRPRNKWTYEDGVDLADLAAANGYGLVTNHGFVDGNKRVAFLALGLFLALNGRRLTADKVEATRAMLGVAAGEVGEEDLAEWLRIHSAPRR